MALGCTVLSNYHTLVEAVITNLAKTNWSKSREDEYRKTFQYKFMGISTINIESFQLVITYCVKNCNTHHYIAE